MNRHEVVDIEDLVGMNEESGIKYCFSPANWGERQAKRGKFTPYTLLLRGEVIVQ